MLWNQTTNQHVNRLVVKETENDPSEDLHDKRNLESSSDSG